MTMALEVKIKTSCKNLQRCRLKVDVNTILGWIPQLPPLLHKCMPLYNIIIIHEVLTLVGRNGVVAIVEHGRNQTKTSE